MKTKIEEKEKIKSSEISSGYRLTLFTSTEHPVLCLHPLFSPIWNDNSIKFLFYFYFRGAS